MAFRKNSAATARRVSRGGRPKTPSAGRHPTVRKPSVNPKNSKTAGETDDPRSSTSATSSSDAGSVDKIRDILFGAQMRDHEKKVARLEERLLKETTDLRDELKKSLAMFESFFKQEFEAQSNRLKSEQGDRAAAIKELAQELKQVGQLLQHKTSQIDEQMASSQRDLRQQMLDQARRLSEEIRDKSTESANALKRETDELRLEKTDRAALAALFTEVALRLRDEFEIPGAEHLKK